MSENNGNYFVEAAVIAANLNNATKIARTLSLTASNARAIALRAGERAGGFRPLTEFIDRLAKITISSSVQINQLAESLSRTAADRLYTQQVLAQFDLIYQKAKDSLYINSLDFGYNRTKVGLKNLNVAYEQQLNQLVIELGALKDELKTAVILTTLSRVEASQAGSEYWAALNSVADNVEQAASAIKLHIQTSLKLVASLRQE